MTAFGDKWRKSGGGGSTTGSSGGSSSSGGSLASIWRKDKSGGSVGGARLIEMNRAVDEEKQKEIIIKQQEAIAQFQQKQEEVQKMSQGNIFQKAKSLYQGVKSFFGGGEILPEIQGGSNRYNAIRNTQQAEQEYQRNIGGRIAIGAESAGKGIKDFFSRKTEELKKSKEERGIIGTQIEGVKGAAKNLTELASGAGKIALEFSPLTGMSGIRRVMKFVGGQQVEEYIDRNSPDYVKRVDAFIDDNGILNYKAKYSNEIQKTGGEVAEIGSWFFPITRAGKVGKLEQAIAEIPRVSKLLGATPKIVKVGGKLMFEVSKDVVDVATLDALRGKTWDETKEDLKGVAIGGTALRSVGGVAGFFKNRKTNKIIKSVEDSIPDLDDAERKIVSDLVAEGKTTDDIATEIFSKREQAGKDIYKVAEKVEVPKALPTGEAPKLLEGTKQLVETKGIYVNKKGELVGNNFVMFGPRGGKFNVPSEIKKRGVELSDGRTFYPIGEEAPSKLQKYAGYDGRGKYKPEIPKSEVPKTEIPESGTVPSGQPEIKVESGGKVASKVSLNVEAKAIEKKLTSGFGEDLAGYTPTTVKEQAEKAAKIINDDIEKARKIIKGEESLPSDVRGGAFIKGMEDYANKKGDVELIKEIATSPLASETSVHAQELRMLAERDTESVVAQIQRVVKERATAIEQRVKGKNLGEARKKVASGIKEAMKKVKTTKDDWVSFIEELKCK